MSFVVYHIVGQSEDYTIVAAGQTPKDRGFDIWPIARFKTRESATTWVTNMGGRVKYVS